MTPHQLLKVLTDKSTDATTIASCTPKGKRLLKSLGQKIEDLLHPIPAHEEQRVANEVQLHIQEDKQRAIDDIPIIRILGLTNLPTTMKTRNLAAKRALKSIQHTKGLHRRVTRNNMRGIIRADITQDLKTAAPPMLRRLTRTQPQPHVLPPVAHHRLVRQQAISILTLQEQASFSTVHTPCALMKYTNMLLHFEHFASPMVYPVTGQTITSYKKLMNNLKRRRRCNER
jgi:hypothetical protein